ncbi:MAG: O-antigen ligase family protein [Desulfosporosinus sp.]|nr:O-antigen ligase family protein [Desulfosporosinus sp.]
MHYLNKANNFNDEQKIAFLIVFLWGYSALMQYVLQVIKIVTSSASLASVFNIIVVGITIFLAIIPVCLRLTKSDVLFFLAVGFIFDVSIMIYPSNATYIIKALPVFFFTVLPYYFVGRVLVDFKQTMKYLHIVSLIVLFTSVAYYIYYFFSGRIIVDNNMYFAYVILPSILILLYSAIEKGGILHWLIGLGGVLFVMMQGTRGPVVCIMAFLLLYFLLHITNIKILFLYIVFLVVGGGIALSNSFLPLIRQLGVVLARYHISNRVIEMFLQKQFTNDDGRAVLYEQVIKGIWQHPYFGNGIMGDRVLTQTNLFTANGTYAHNLLLELWCDFGILIGTLLILALLVLIWNALRNTTDREPKVLIIILIVMGIVQLMMSSSFIYEPYLFLLIGVCVNLKSRNHEIT